MKKTNFINTSLPAIIACFLWSTAFVGVKICLQFSPPLFLAGIRFMIAGLMLLPFCGSLSKVFKEIKEHGKSILLVCLFQTVILYALFTVGMTLVPGAIGAIIIGASPITTAIITHFFVKGDKLSLPKALKILLGVGGIVLVSVSRSSLETNGRENEIIGIILLLGATVASAIGNITVSKAKKGISPLILNSAQLFLGGFILFLASLVLEKGFFTPPGNDSMERVLPGMSFYLALIYLAFLSAAAFSIWFRLLQKPGVKVSDLNVWKFIIPVFGALNAWIILPDESPQMATITGMLIVGLAVTLFYISPNRKKTKGDEK